MNDTERYLLVTVAQAVRDMYTGSTSGHTEKLDQALSYLKPAADDRDLLLAVARCVGDMGQGGRHREIRKLLEPFNVISQPTLDELSKSGKADKPESAIVREAREHHVLAEQRDRALKLNPDAQHKIFGADKAFLDRWGRGPLFLVLYSDGMRCQCGGVVEYRGTAGGSELFECGACGTRGSRLADREIEPEHRAIMQPTITRFDEGQLERAEVPADVAAAIRDGGLHQKISASVSRAVSASTAEAQQRVKARAFMPPAPAPTPVQKGGIPGLNDILGNSVARLAWHIRLARFFGFIRKGGHNYEPSQVVTRPKPPGAVR